MVLDYPSLSHPMHYWGTDATVLAGSCCEWVTVLGHDLAGLLVINDVWCAEAMGYVSMYRHHTLTMQRFTLVSTHTQHIKTTLGVTQHNDWNFTLRQSNTANIARISWLCWSLHWRAMKSGQPLVNPVSQQCVTSHQLLAEGISISMTIQRDHCQSNRNSFMIQ